MKKILILAIICNITLSSAQIGIGRANPRGALDINKDDDTNTMGLVLPTNADVNNILNPLGGNVVPGTIIYDSTNDCVRLYKGTGAWSNCLSDTICDAGGSIGDLDCDNVSNIGILTSGIAASGVSSTFSYTGGNGGAHNGQIVPSTGVTGLTATLAPGNFETGNGTLEYIISGTPSSTGTATFAIEIAGKICSLTRNVIAPVGTINDLKCASATHNGSLVSNSAANNVSSDISYEGGNGGTHNGQTVTSTGVLGLTATLAPGNFAVGSGTLNYKITGTPTSSGTASFVLNIGGKSCTITRNVTSGNPPLPDLTANCTGWRVHSNSGTVNGTVKGVPLSATVTLNNAHPSSANFTSDSPYYSCSTGYQSYFFTETSALSSTIRIKFNKNVSNIKLYLFDHMSVKANNKVTLKRNGAIVTPTFTKTSAFCSQYFSVSQGNIKLTKEYDGSGNGFSGAINIGGIWFDEIEVVASIPSFSDVNGYFAICVGDVQ
ncbi:hypothetical protein [Chryseobacterium sp. MMS23-Vi53]|uniref:hypothetical protein n=1 Tax=Chryseobacterium sp. MMS23-Vi53 TaxID=3386644 RepID=UPI0039E76A65